MSNLSMTTEDVNKYCVIGNSVTNYSNVYSLFCHYHAMQPYQAAYGFAYDDTGNSFPSILIPDALGLNSVSLAFA